MTAPSRFKTRAGELAHYYPDIPITVAHYYPGMPITVAHDQFSMTQLPTIDLDAPVPVTRRKLAVEHDEALRWRFLCQNWHSTIDGKPLHRWLDDNTLRYGGLEKAIDFAMNGPVSSFASL